jgi:hypothetical protein
MNKNALTRTTSVRLAVFLMLSFSVASPVIRAPNKSAQSHDQAASQRGDEIAKLLAVLRDAEVRKMHPEQVVSAIQRLGEMRAVEAIDDLVGLLTFARRFEWERDDAIIEIQPITPGNRYPASEALFEIGRPALPALVKVIELNKLDSLPGQNALFAIRNIFRENLSEGVKYLKSAAEASATPDSAQNLSRAAGSLNNLAAQPPHANKQ